MLNHTFSAIINKDSQILILGSFPSVKSREGNFFYMHPQNRFWRLLSIIFGDDFVNADIENKACLLKKHKIALYDVIESCNIIGSSDSTITDVTPTDVLKLIGDTAIKHIYLNGKIAYNLFIKYYPSLTHMATYLPSTSPANAAYDMERLYEKWKIIR